MSIEPPPWKPRGGYKWICGKNLKLPVSEPPLNSRGGGANECWQVWVCKNVLTIWAPPPNNWGGACKWKLAGEIIQFFFSQTEPPPLQIPGSAPDMFQKRKIIVSKELYTNDMYYSENDVKFFYIDLYACRGGSRNLYGGGGSVCENKIV